MIIFDIETTGLSVKGERIPQGIPHRRDSRIKCERQPQVGKPFRLVVSRVHVANDAHPRIGRQHALDAFRHGFGAVGDRDLSGVQRIANAHTSAIVDRHPRCASSRINRAFSSGQSATASLPSFMLSVSRKGDATEPQSRWSRPITIGALILPFFTRSLMASPNWARSPYPSQQILAGNPWNLIRFSPDRSSGAEFGCRGTVPESNRR